MWGHGEFPFFRTEVKVFTLFFRQYWLCRVRRSTSQSSLLQMSGKQRTKLEEGPLKQETEASLKQPVLRSSIVQRCDKLGSLSNSYHRLQRLSSSEDAMASSTPSGNNTHHSSLLIIGAGIFGTSTAYHLARTHPTPGSITVLDRGPSPSPRAASSDINKIVRADYSSAFYMALAYEAMDAWASWPILKDFYHRTGWVVVDEKDSDLAERIRKNFRESGREDESKDLSLEEVKTEWGGVFNQLDTTNFDKAYVNPSAGWCDASLAVEAMMREAISKGVRYEVGEAAELVPSPDSTSLRSVKTTDDRTFTFDKLLLCAGAWTPWLMDPLESHLKIADSDSIHRQISSAGVCTTAFKVSSQEDLNHFSQMPVLIYGSQGEAMPPNSDGLLKLTNANTFTNPQRHPITGRTISAPSMDQNDIPADLALQCTSLVVSRIPRLVHNHHTVEEWRLCWDAVSPDQNQLISQHPDPRLENLYLATAGSFHSWKFLPVIGNYVINVLEGKSNGEERDRAWEWKRKWADRGAHEKVLPKSTLRDFVRTGDRPLNS